MNIDSYFLPFYAHLYTILNLEVTFHILIPYQSIENIFLLFSAPCFPLYEGENEVTQSCPTLRPHGPTRLLHPWDFLGKNTGVGCHFLLQEIFPTQGSNPGLPHCRQALYCLSYQEIYDCPVIYLPNRNGCWWSPGLFSVFTITMSATIKNFVPILLSVWKYTCKMNSPKGNWTKGFWLLILIDIATLPSAGTVPIYTPISM